MCVLQVFKCKQAIGAPKDEERVIAFGTGGILLD